MRVDRLSANAFHFLIIKFYWFIDLERSSSAIDSGKCMYTAAAAVAIYVTEFDVNSSFRD